MTTTTPHKQTNNATNAPTSAETIGTRDRRHVDVLHHARKATTTATPTISQQIGAKPTQGSVRQHPPTTLVPDHQVVSDNLDLQVSQPSSRTRRAHAKESSADKDHPDAAADADEEEGEAEDADT
jgi:hypothetical protein